MNKFVRFVSPVAFGLAASTLAGCTLEKRDDASEFREALPLSTSVAIDGPDSARAGDPAAGGSERLAVRSSANEPAFWYTFTRNVRDGVNLVTGGVLAGVWLIVHTEPSELEEDRALFGPYEGDALDPARYRLEVTRIGEDRFEYRLEGQSKAGGDYLAVLVGDGYSRQSAMHGDGRFVLDLDHARTLDPSRHANDSGKVTIEHDLPADIGRKRNALPRVIRAVLEPAGQERVEITSHALEDATGELTVGARVNLEDSDSDALEDVSITSRWRATGAGRSDILMSGGDIQAAGVDVVSAVECWGTDFGRVYYSDSLGLAESVGDAGDCAYGTAR